MTSVHNKSPLCSSFSKSFFNPKVVKPPQQTLLNPEPDTEPADHSANSFLGIAERWRFDKLFCKSPEVIDPNKSYTELIDSISGFMRTHAAQLDLALKEEDITKAEKCFGLLKKIYLKSKEHFLDRIKTMCMDMEENCFNS